MIIAPGWTYGNRVRLLENGEEYYPAVLAAIRSARREVLLETFILFEDRVGRELQAALIGAATRGVRVEVTADAYGSPDLSAEFLGELSGAGVRFHFFDPRPRIFGMRTNTLRRLHRKLLVIDRRKAFVGGINFSEDHLADFGPMAKQDYAVEVEGPVVDDIRALMEALIGAQPMPRTRPWWRLPSFPLPVRESRPDGAAITFVWRDNANHRDDIELHYRAAIRAARRDVLIANAYFFPGYRLLRELRLAAKRGVHVRLLLQGVPDHRMMRWAARTLYDFLLRSGVEIYEYCERSFHGKVAVIDDDWTTIGSSNLDPLSLSLNLEANLVIRDQALSRELHSRLDLLIRNHCEAIDPHRARRRTLWRQLFSYFVFHVVRRYPKWAGWLPMRKQRVVIAEVDGTTTEAVRRDAA
jgi:cardiolipin synthase A/B